MLQRVHRRRGLVDVARERDRAVRGSAQQAPGPARAPTGTRARRSAASSPGRSRAARAPRADGRASRRCGSGGRRAGRGVRCPAARARRARSASSTRWRGRRDWQTDSPSTQSPRCDGLAAVAPGGDALGVDDLTFDVHAGDEEPVALVGEELEHRARVLAHQDRVRRVVVDAELVADAVALADPVQGDPRRRRVADVVVEVVAGVQPGIGHCSTRYCRPRSLASWSSGTKLCSNSIRFWSIDFDWSRPTKPHTAGTPSKDAASITAQHEVVLLAADRRVLVEHVVEVGDVGDRDAGVVDGCLDPLGAHARSNGSRRSSVLATGSSIASAGTSASEGCSAADSSMQSASSSAAKSSHSSTARSGSGSRSLAWRQLLERRGEHSDRHVHRFERGWSVMAGSPMRLGCRW